MKLLRPSKLNDGDTIGVIAPSYPVLPFHEMYLQGVENLRKFGFKVKEGETVRLQYFGHMAGTDAQRAEDINNMFADEEVKAIICALGGQVAIRTLRYLNFDLVKANPKIFSGMSDITTFHVAFLAKTGLVGLHQTDVTFGFGTDMNSKEAKYEIDLFFKVTKRAEPLGLLPAFTRWEVWRDGKAEGRLFGGNVPSLQALLATPYFPKLSENIIFFWEAMTQPLDVLDQRLVQFREAGLFDKVKGMLVGKIRGEEDKALKDMTGEVKKVILNITNEFDFPIIANMDFGHFTPNLPLPMGLKASMDTEGA
ncbi:MAG: LD-carboxypeptidase, partial [Candidatus Bathyarchaeota archaeon]|nr:LD-carboxypeptidase [Candidatus Bathyarchaeota archaeon]